MLALGIYKSMRKKWESGFTCFGLLANWMIPRQAMEFKGLGVFGRFYVADGAEEFGDAELWS